MDNIVISKDFTVDDIHRIREQQDIKYKDISDDIRIKDYHIVAQKVLEEIRLLRKTEQTH